MKNVHTKQGWRRPALFFFAMLLSCLHGKAQSYTSRDVIYYNADSSTINGDKDIISDATINLEGFRRSVRKKLLQTWKAPGLNHLYQHCTRCTADEYGKLPEAMAPEVITCMEQFINAVTR